MVTITKIVLLMFYHTTLKGIKLYTSQKIKLVNLVVQYDKNVCIDRDTVNI